MTYGDYIYIQEIHIGPHRWYFHSLVFILTIVPVAELFLTRKSNEKKNCNTEYLGAEKEVSCCVYLEGLVQQMGCLEGQNSWRPEK